VSKTLGQDIAKINRYQAERVKMLGSEGSKFTIEDADIKKVDGERDKVQNADKIKRHLQDINNRYKIDDKRKKE
jgi:hypothetical protein